MTHPKPTSRRHPLVLPGILSACFTAGVAVSLYTGAPGIAGGILSALPLVSAMWAIRASLNGKKR